jgi:hypothetical protein
MLRVLDVKNALEALPVSSHARGELVIDVRDPVLPTNERAWRVHARDGQLTVRAETTRLAASRDKRPRLTLDVAVLAMIVSGRGGPGAGRRERDARGGARWR